jgi:hypothetical protein
LQCTAREECKVYTSRMLQWLEDLGAGFSSKDPETWKPEHMPEMFNGIINSQEISHQDFVWKVRSHPLVLKVGFGHHYASLTQAVMIALEHYRLTLVACIADI